MRRSHTIGYTLLVLGVVAVAFTSEAANAFRYISTTYSLIYLDSADLLIGCF